MRLKRFNLFLKITLLLASFLFLSLSIFAVQFGLDNDPGWGKGRILLFVLGLFSFIAWLRIQFSKFFDRKNQAIKMMVHALFRNWSHLKIRTSFYQVVQSAIVKRTESLSIHFPHFLKAASPKFKRGFAATVGIALGTLLLIYFGGLNHSGFRQTNYYDQLADGFLAGQTSLLESPPPELLALENPYDWKNREGLRYIWDASLFEGRYYLYWGIVPGFIAALIKLIHPMILLDQYLVLAFYLGILILFTAILALLHKQFFSAAPYWSITAFSVVCASSAPLLWLINRPSVYEVAISSGQFFFLLGLLIALPIFWETKIPAWRLVFTGFAWGAAINCRFNLLAAIGWLCLGIAFRLVRKESRSNWTKNIIYLAFPLVLWSGVFFTYNAIRFGSIIETGHRYQLTGPALPLNYQEVISVQYLIPSIYSYLFRPVTIDMAHFPFFSIPFIKESMWPVFIHLPENYYYPEPVAGLMWIIPALFLILIPVLGHWKRFDSWIHEQKPRQEYQYPDKFRVIWILLFIAAGLLLLPLFLFISTSLRYIVDVMPLLLLLSNAGYWWIAGNKHISAGISRFWVVPFIFLLGLSVWIGISVNLNLY